MNRTVALALATALAPSIALPATPAQATSTPAAAPAAAKVVQTMRVDLDGDGRKDKVTLTQYGDIGYRVSVTTSKKHTSRAVVMTEAPVPPLYAAAKLDSTKGYELILATGGEELTGGVVLTWRKNKLVTEKAPARTSLDGTVASGWWWGEGAESVAGYRFFTSKKKRYVDVFSFETVSPIVRTRSVWRGGAWHKVSVTRIATDEWVDDLAKKYGDFTGVKLIFP